MPRYRIVKALPPVLAYRDGKVFFEDYYAGGKEWVWYCRREVVHNRSINLCTAEDALELERMRREGIEVKKDSSADRVLQSLTRKGFAVRLPD